MAEAVVEAAGRPTVGLLGRPMRRVRLDVVGLKVVEMALPHIEIDEIGGVGLERSAVARVDLPSLRPPASRMRRW